MRRLKLMGHLFMIVILLFGCSSLKSFSPNQILEKTLAASKKDEVSYYGEINVEIIGNEGKFEFEKATIKEWHRNGRVRNELDSSEDGEVILTSDGSVIQMYFVDHKKVIETTIDESDNYLLSPKEQFDQLLVMLRNTHNIETVGKETIADRSAFHLQATNREDKNSIFGNLDLWIDEEYWLPLKMVVKTGDIEMKMEFTKIDFDASFDDSLFVLDLPNDDSIEMINNVNDKIEISLDEIAEKFGKPVNVIEENDSWEISSIYLSKVNTLEHSELLEIDYKYKGVPSLIMLVSHIDESTPSVEVFGDITEKVTIREHEGYIIDSAEIVLLSWRENGLEYALQLINPKVNLSEIIKLAESMITIK